MVSKAYGSIVKEIDFLLKEVFELILESDAPQETSSIDELCVLAIKDVET